jgi:acyl-lipid (7-3)-desaturase (Delta-4 desaturase)
MCLTSSTPPAASPKLALLAFGSVKDLQPNQVCIDGDVFDLNGFDHPGGDSIYVFGGNDVTVLYKMIHPHHPRSHVAKKLSKVGHLEHYQCE